MPTLWLTRGIPASGKTTYAKAWLADDPENRARVNRDDLRAMLFHDYRVPEYLKEEIVTAVQRTAVKGLLKMGKDVIIDDMNLTARFAKSWYEITDNVVFIDFPLDVEEAVRRDSLRERPVGEDVIRDIASRHYHKGTQLRKPPASPQMPVLRPYRPNEKLRPAYIFDIDGTLAKMNGRDPYSRDQYHTDTVHDPVRYLLEALGINHDILIVTGRGGDARVQTEAWLRNNGIEYVELFMRPEGDPRNDAIVKAEILHDHIAPRWNVLGAFDDRDRVVAAWRTMGVKCFQVEPGDF